MRSKYLTILTITMIFLLPCVSIATDDTDANGVEKAGTGHFLYDGVGARPLAMGGSFVAIADDATAAYWNPAGLGQLTGSSMSVMYADRFTAGLRYQFLNFVGGPFGISLIRLNAVDVLHVTQRDTLGHPIRTDGIVKHSDNALLVTYGLKLNENLYLGVTGKGLYMEMLEDTATGWGVDAGVLFKTPMFSVGANVQNIRKGQLKWDNAAETEDTIPMNIKVGGAVYLLDKMIIAAADMDIRAEEKILHLGGEVWPLKDVLAIRAGLHNQNFAVGLGLKFTSLCFDYALQTHTLGLTHRVSMNLAF